jgi:hypothetical protein
MEEIEIDEQHRLRGDVVRGDKARGEMARENIEKTFVI